jgi:hypothetical protein
LSGSATHVKGIILRGNLGSAMKDANMICVYFVIGIEVLKNDLSSTKNVY